MALPITRPTKHPRTGTYRLRLAIPAELRETAEALYEVRREFIASLGTTNEGQAKAKAGDVLAGLYEKLAAVRAIAAGEAPRLTQRQIAALEGYSTGNSLRFGRMTPAMLTGGRANGRGGRRRYPAMTTPPGSDENSRGVS